ncbi:hypothetical protein C349_02502 [Cryptococcus neoformans var. grubii Br795]|nr:hypothetical protein C350_02363 [Cryptococcus neoformans var. grubii MW-RSA36]OXG84456.1 hypothetical protein C349_02502 [Cryptococcus neoformans var. grubii Br795]OXL09095.1 hypothetical protein C348_02596 [Cryptococcus neoformans var. grubii Gb118]
MGIVSHFIKLFKWAGNKVSEHPSSSSLPPSSSTTRSSAPNLTHAPTDPSPSTPPLNVKTSMFVLPTIANDKEEMKKGVSLNVILDLDPSEQKDEKIRAETIQNLHLAKEVNNTRFHPSSSPTSLTDSITEETDQIFHRPNTPVTSRTSHVDDPFYISPVKVQVIRTFNYLGVNDKLRSLPPIRPGSLHCMEELDKVMKAITAHYLPNKTQPDTSIPTVCLDDAVADRFSTTQEGVLDKGHPIPIFGGINSSSRRHTKSDSFTSFFSMYGHMSEDELISRDRSMAPTLIPSPNETSNTLPNPTTLLQPHTTLSTALYLSDTPRSAPGSSTGSDDSTNSSIPEIIITPDNSQNSVDYLSFSPNKRDPNEGPTFQRFARRPSQILQEEHLSDHSLTI